MHEIHPVEKIEGCSLTVYDVAAGAPSQGETQVQVLETVTHEIRERNKSMQRLTKASVLTVRLPGYMYVPSRVQSPALSAVGLLSLSTSICANRD